MQHCKNLRVALTLLWVMSVACSGASIVPSVMSAAISIWTWPPEFLVIYQNGSFTIWPQNSCYLSELFLYYGHRISCYLYLATMATELSEGVLTIAM